MRLLAGAFDRAQAEGSQALIVQLNTPGGLERSMRSMVQSILGSPIPVIVYVAPVTLGAGAPLLPRRVELRLEETGRNGDFVATRYSVVHGE